MPSAAAVGEVLDHALVEFDGETLIADTGSMRRTWTFTGKGFLTQSISLPEGKCWRLPSNQDRDADWLLPVCETGNPEATLVAVTAAVDDDEGFTSRHVRFTAEMHYPDVKLALRFSVWVYPGASGMRTALHVKGLDGFCWERGASRVEIGERAHRAQRLDSGYRRLDFLPVDPAELRRRAVGYYSDTQNRNDLFLDLLHEAVDDRHLTRPAVCEWASAVCVEGDAWGLALVKESHKCVNQCGHDTGAFLFLPGRGVESCGWGILPREIDDRWRPAWASWCIAYAVGDRCRQQAFKTFDRLRYPVRPEELLIQANTWGSSQGWLEHREAAAEKSVLQEIDHCADLGIEVLQIDDGWQGNDYQNWQPCPERYPQGWEPVRRRAAEKGIRLGLWLSGAHIRADDLARSTDGGFVSYKIDFVKLQGRHGIDDLMTMVRDFLKAREQKVRVNWDLTEVKPRYGYFFAREYGCVYLANRKPVLPRSTTYRPGVVLRDLWQLAKYCNLFKFQGSVQNLDDVDPLFSDGAGYDQAYCVAVTLMSSPLFFCETKRFSDSARSAIRPLLAAYRQVRDEMSRGVVHPLGEKPDGTRWTGFECELPKRDGGFLLLFREPWSEQNDRGFCLAHLAGATLALTDLMTGETKLLTLDERGHMPFGIDQAGTFRFLRYRIE